MDRNFRLSRQCRAGGGGVLGQAGDELAGAVAQDSVGNAAAGGDLGVNLGDRQFGFDQVGADDREYLAQVRQGPGGAALAGTQHRWANRISAHIGEPDLRHALHTLRCLSEAVASGSPACRGGQGRLDVPLSATARAGNETMAI
jgi:hypothetical protein